MSATSTRIDRALKKVAERDSGIHAVLLYGNDAVVLDRLSRQVAKGWLCNADSGRPCGSCTPCSLFEKGETVDELAVAPSGPSNLITLEQITRVPVPKDRNVLPVKEFSQIRPVIASHRVVRVVDADRMNEDASNALLKTLEEPSPSMRFVLTTQNLGVLRSTIVSRCLAVACPVGEDSIEQERPMLTEILRQITPTNALFFADRFRKSVGEEGDDADLAQRLANTRAIDELGRWISRHDPGGTESRKAVAVAHRRTQGNGNFAIITDWLFLRLARTRNSWNLGERE
ncbi:MAG: hypothetical protein HONBIEJF_01334 [Fimbriimonadaceae bacterium]|nr:hypothetical protein [Fimbriimonadaceae bacterium]